MGGRGLARSALGVVAAAGLLVGPAALVVALAGPAAASTIHVSTETDFRNAFDSSANDTIVLDADIHLGTGTCTRAARAQSAPITIDGQGRFKIVQDCTGNTVLSVDSGGGDLTLRGVTITGGSGSDDGGGLHFEGGALTIDHSTFVANNILGGTDSDGGAVDAEANGPVTITDSSFLNNHATGDGGALDCGESAPSVMITVTGSTFAGNSTEGAGHRGGAIDMEDNGCSVKLVNSTVTGNTSADLAAVTAQESDNSLTLIYTDVVNNTAANLGARAASNPGQPSGGNTKDPKPPDPSVHNQAVAISPANVFLATPANFTTFASVITGPIGGPNCGTSGGGPLSGITSLGYNFADDTTCGLTGTGDKQAVGNNPLLGPLANNGGPTETLLPQDGPSPLIDGVPAAHCGDGNTLAGFTITTDQRLLARPDTGSPNCDIGAVEVQSAAPTLTVAFTG